jgi:hypothetical protein
MGAGGLGGEDVADVGDALVLDGGDGQEADAGPDAHVGHDLAGVELADRLALGRVAGGAVGGEVPGSRRARAGHVARVPGISPGGWAAWGMTSSPTKPTGGLGVARDLPHGMLSIAWSSRVIWS